MNRPKSLFIGISTIVSMVLAFLIAAFISTFHLVKSLSIAIAFFEFAALIGSIAGIIVGLRYSTENTTYRNLNWIGILLNLIVFLGLGGVLYFAFTQVPRP